MCEIFTLIGTAIAASVGATVGTAAAATGVLGVITAGTATAIGVGATALTVFSFYWCLTYNRKNGTTTKIINKGKNRYNRD